MKRLFVVLLGVAALVLAVPAAADPPTAFPFEFVFDDVNPCTGLTHTVTIAGITLVHDHDGRIVAHSERTITTSPSGFVGHGADSHVLNGQVEMFRLADILTNSSGDRIRARTVIMVDLSSGTVRGRDGRAHLPGTGLILVGREAEVRGGAFRSALHETERRAVCAPLRLIASRPQRAGERRASVDYRDIGADQVRRLLINAALPTIGVVLLKMRKGSR
jgi:hypothetical protein